MSRTNYSMKNLKYTLIGQFSRILISFLSRTIFVIYLNAEYLGLNGLFTNILSVLSVAELGIGTAIAYSLYEPLAEKNEKKISAIIRLYRNAYITIGVWMCVAGLVSSHFLEFIIRDMPEIPNIKLIYLMYIANSAISYFLSYKRTLIIADQKKYIDAIYHDTTFLILNAIQIVVLVFTQNFIAYLGIKIIATFVENLLLSIKANKLYPFLRFHKKEKLDDESKSNIIKNVKAMFFHRIGGAVVLGTDNLLISKFVGIVSVGIYSNYLLIINTLKIIFAVVFQSVIASIGNFSVTENNTRLLGLFRTLDFLGYWIYGFSSIALFNLLNPFINLWLGDDYTFPARIVLLIVVNFYIQGQRLSVMTFKEALGLFWYDRYKPIFESVINLTFSIYLANAYGLSGVILGTIISTVLTAFWIEPLVLYKYGLKRDISNYFFRYLKRIFFILVIGVITRYLCNLIPGVAIWTFLAKIFICLVIPNILIVIFFHKTSEFKELYIISRKFIKYRH